MSLRLLKKPTPWSCGCAWKLESAAQFYHNDSPGALVLSVSADGRYKRDIDKVPYVLGLRYEFNMYTKPSLALRLLAFYEMAKDHPAFKAAGYTFSILWHEQRRRYFNWQINLNVPVCEVSKSDAAVTGLQSAPEEWLLAFQRIADTLVVQEKLVRELLSKPLVCTSTVWERLLLWYESNRQGLDIQVLTPEMKEAIQPLIGLSPEELSAQLPAPLDFLVKNPDAPIGDVRVPAPDNEKAFRQWLGKHAGASDKSQSRYLQEVVSLRKNVPELFDERDINSLYDIETPAAVEELIADLRETDWFLQKTARRPGVKPGGSDALTVLNHYKNFLIKPTIKTEQPPMKQEQKTMALDELLASSERNELLTGSKPIYLSTPWGKVENNSWRALYNAVWDKAWSEKSGEIIARGDLVSRKDAEEFLEKPHRYHSLGAAYAVYNNYGTTVLVPKIARLFAVCGVGLDAVKVCFVTNKEDVQPSMRDVELNTILYGPPGTGKTFNSAAYAVAICESRPVHEVLQENHETVKKRYDNYASQGRIAFTTFHQSYEYGDFIEGLAPVVKGGSIAYEVKTGVFREFCEQVPDEPCVFIIDEINRGNISKILGELITLIEESKRGKLSVKLPVSGEEFTVPRNVYILGTMNTADRSLAMMDTALRRRFDFVRMDPQPELLPADVDGVDVPMMLRTMNKRICWLYDAEHTLGHALFWGLQNDPTLEELGRIFRKKVIPLLMEYFHDDYAKVKQVLGNSSMMEEENLPADLFSRQEELDLLQSQYHPLPDADPRWEDAVTYTAIYM